MDYSFLGREQLLLTCWEEMAIGLVPGSYRLHPLRGTFLSCVASHVLVGQDNAVPELDTQGIIPAPRASFLGPERPRPSAQKCTTPSLMPSCSHLQIVHNKRSCILFCNGSHKLGSWSYLQLDASSLLVIQGSGFCWAVPTCFLNHQGCWVWMPTQRHPAYGAPWELNLTHAQLSPLCIPPAVVPFCNAQKGWLLLILHQNAFWQVVVLIMFTLTHNKRNAK